jgi:DNA-binding transcriptional LysR family regulator
VELRQIRYAVAVAEHRHFGRAAEHVFIAQPALSQHIRRLEHELGVTLFDRGARHVRVTPAGEAFLTVARGLLQQADVAAAAARRAECGDVGSIVVAVSRPLALPLLAPLLRRWAQARPEVDVRLTTGAGPRLVDRVRRREVDVALVEEPGAGGDVSAVHLADDPLVLLVPPDADLAARTSIEPEELAGRRFVAVTRDASPALHDRLLGVCVAAGFTPDIALEVDAFDLVAPAVAATIGVAVVPRSTALTSGLAWVPVEGSTPALALSLFAVTASAGATPQARDFVAVAARHADRARHAAARRLQLAAS